MLTYDVDVSDKNGMVVGTTVVEAPAAGFGLVGITVTEVTSSDVVLVINGENSNRVPLENGRLALQVTASSRRTGRNPQTGEVITIKARNVILQGSVTIFGSNGETHGVTTIKALISHPMDTGIP